eukprot:TRINITY_DN15511_c0_g1_i1.p1 TRINITY_DN15511_c0_g1~~TRINITY_DN15511_c0_g1_i1.p1  ORF type:complete len:339 (-),score=87.71 TRINITY_DN15511_c0_g1_i1:372-1388(-)
MAMPHLDLVTKADPVSSSIYFDFRRDGTPTFADLPAMPASDSPPSLSAGVMRSWWVKAAAAGALIDAAWLGRRMMPSLRGAKEVMEPPGVVKAEEPRSEAPVEEPKILQESINSKSEQLPETEAPSLGMQGLYLATGVGSLVGVVGVVGAVAARRQHVQTLPRRNKPRVKTVRLQGVPSTEYFRMSTDPVEFRKASRQSSHMPGDHADYGLATQQLDGFGRRGFVEEGGAELFQMSVSAGAFKNMGMHMDDSDEEEGDGGCGDYDDFGLATQQLASLGKRDLSVEYDEEEAEGHEAEGEEAQEEGLNCSMGMHSITSASTAATPRASFSPPPMKLAGA